MDVRCAEVVDSVDAYVIGALDADEARALDAHAAACTACVSRIESARRTSYALALAVPWAQPNATVKARVMEGAIALAAPRELARSHRRLVAVAAALFVVAAAALSWGALERYRTHIVGRGDLTLGDTQGRVTDRSEWAAALLDVAMSPDAERVELTGTALAPSASARYVWSASRGLGVLDVAQLPVLSPGASYELTLVYASKTESGGSFTIDNDGKGELVVRDIDSSDDGRPHEFQVATTPSSGQPNVVLVGIASE